MILILVIEMILILVIVFLIIKSKLDTVIHLLEEIDEKLSPEGVVVQDLMESLKEKMGYSKSIGIGTTDHRAELPVKELSAKLELIDHKANRNR